MKKIILIVLILMSFGANGFAKVKLQSLVTLSEHQVRDITSALSMMMIPKVLTAVDAINKWDFELAFENGVYHLDRFENFATVDRTDYAPSFSLKAGVTDWLRFDVSLFGAESGFFNGATGLHFQLLKQCCWFFSFGYRSMYSYLKFDKYRSHSWANDFIFSRTLSDLSKALGDEDKPASLYLGVGVDQVWAKIYDDVRLQRKVPRIYRVVGGKFFAGLTKKLTKRWDTGVDATFFQDAEVYTVKLSLDF